MIALKQVTQGLLHLHKLKIIHRDLKPQNILVASVAPLRMVISDFGLCRKLDVDESSFLQSSRAGGNNAPGSYGYRAPEVLRGEVDTSDLINKEEPAEEESLETTTTSSRSVNSGNYSLTAIASKKSTTSLGRKLTRSIDIFSLGCVFYFVLTNGDHPFGSRFEREVNILKDKLKLDGLAVMTEGRYEADQIVRSMCSADPYQRSVNPLLVHYS